MTYPSQQAALSMLVRRLECIGHLSDEQRQAIEKLPARLQAFGARQDIVRDGDRPSQCCLLVEGWAFRYKLLDDGRRQILSFHVPGEIPDLMSLHLHTMDHNLATLTSATLAFIPHEALLDVTRYHPGLADILWRETLTDAAVFQRRMASLGRQSGFDRMAHLFCELYWRLEVVGLAAGGHCTLPTTQSELGDALGLSHVHLNRVLQEMRAQNLITLRGQALFIPDWTRLAKAAEFNPAYLHLVK